MMLGLRADLAALNPLLPVVLAVQRIAGRDRVFPFIAQVKQRQEGMALANMLRATMEVSRWGRGHSRGRAWHWPTR
eukprot:365994-Chlamydomonas_euryale.AAC.19